tara:strand:- start:42 stop:902 length:861 start_codon:yes stop_codon:yes gene_type:complete
MGSKFSIIESEVQKARKTNGTKFEKMIMSKASNDWIVLKSEDVIRDLTTTKMWNCDVVNHKQKIFLELTTSVKDGKESKIINESKTYKHHYPEYKFVVGIEKIHNPRKRDNLDAHIDHLKQTPTIDSVLIGKDEILKFMDKPKFKKQNKRRMNRMNNNALLMETLLHGAKNGDSNGVKSLLNIFGVKEQRKTTKTNNKKRRSEVKKQEWFRENLMNLIHCENEETQSLGDLSKEWWGKSQASRFFSSLAATKAKEDRVKLFGNPNGYPSSWRIKTSDSLKYSKYVK